MKEKIGIEVDDLSDGSVIQLLELHRQEMFKHSPPESVHALDLEAMHAPALTFWKAVVGDTIAACGALKQLDDHHAELKSMKTADAFLGRGVGRALLSHLLQEAKRRGYKRISLETGTMNAFLPARSLYESVGFKKCAPFSDYVNDEFSVCMSLSI